MTILADLRQAVRALARGPGTSLVVIGTVALGIGAVTTVLAIVDAFLLKPLPGVERQDRLVNIHATAADGSSFHSVSLPTWRDLRKDASALEDLAAFSSRFTSLSTGGEPRLAITQIVTANFFSVLGVRPALGRFFLPEEDEAPGRDAVVVLSHRLWSTAFQSDPAAVGRVVRLNGRPFTVVGVAAPGFIGNFLGEPFDLWVPSMMAPALGVPADRFESRSATWLELVGRLKPGESLSSAAAAVTGVGRRLALDDPDIYKGVGYELKPTTGFEDSLRGAAIGFFGTLLALAGLVLAIAGANVSGLLLARAVARERELSIRVALGAGRGRLLSLLLAENVLLFVCGGLAGVALSFGTTALLERVELPLPVPLSFALEPPARVLATGVLLALAAGLVFGLAGTLPATRPGLLAHLRTATTERRASSRLRSGFVAAQVAMSALLLVAAGLFFRTVRHAANVSPGFAPDGLTMTTVDLRLLGYDPVRAGAAFDSLLERVAALPGVEAATTTSLMPLGPGSRTDGVRLPESPASDTPLTVDIADVGDAYFRTLRLPLAAGRTFGPEDSATAALAAIVNETLARKLWPGHDPLGRALVQNGRTLTVVGLARDARYRRLWETPRPFLYLSQRQAGSLRRDLVVRGGGSPEALARALRAAIRAVDPNLPVAAILPVRRYIGLSLLPQRVGSAIAAALGSVGLLLAGIGLAAQVAQSVRRRRREIGIRMALGARPAEVVRLEAARGACLAAIGIAAGLAAALAASRLLASMLYGVRPADPLTFAGVAALLGAVTVAIAFVPARQAARVDPIEALRSE